MPTTADDVFPLDKHDDLWFLAQARPTIPVDEDEYLSFRVGDTVCLVKDGINDEVVITEIDHDFSTTVDYITVLEFQGGHSLTTTKDFLFHLDEVDIANIPLSLEQIEEHVHHLDRADLMAILNPPPPQHAKLFANFLDWHYRVGHLPFEDTFNKQSEMGLMPKSFLTLQQ